MNKWIVKYKQSDVKHEIKDVFYLIALQGVNYIAPLLVLPYLMIVLGAEKFGYIGFSLSVTQYLMLIVDFGFNLSATKRIALNKNDKEALNNIFSSTLYAKIGLLIISFFILLFVAQIPQFIVYRETMFVMFLMVIANAFSFVWLFQGLGQIRIISIMNIISKLTILPFTFLFVKESSDYLIAAFIQAFVFIFGALLTIIIVYKKKCVLFTTFSSISVLKEIKESLPLFLSSAVASIYVASYAFVLGFFSTPAEIGKYSAVERIMRGLSLLILTPTLQSFYPKISALSVNNTTKAKALVKRILIVLAFLMIGVFVGMYFLSPFIISLLGDDYRDTLSLFHIMSVIPFFIAIGGVVGQLGLLAMGENNSKKKFQRAYFIAGLIAVISILLLAPIYEAKGAAISLLITEFVVCVLMIWYGRKLLWEK
ncbi:MAG: flippase [Paludibacteraceae bacterium]|nr:flippase [Paludibacteraceae bacterium]